MAFPTLDAIRSLHWEIRLGIRTRASAITPDPDSADYATLPYDFIWHVLRALDLRREDVFADVGCGRGRVVCCAAQFPARRVLGIEMEPDLCESATANVRSLRRRRAPIEILKSPAEEADYTAVTAIYLFNPFGRDSMRRWLDRVEESLSIRPREVRIAYVDPFWDDELAERPWLQCLDCWSARARRAFTHSTSFWRSRTS